MNIKEHFPDVDTNTVSDGYHTFGELYEHRCLLFVALMQAYPEFAWRSWKNSDGTEMSGWFVAGLELPTGLITYHLPAKLWNLLDDEYILTFENYIKTLEKGRWDGHTSNDVLERLTKFLMHKTITNQP